MRIDVHAHYYTQAFMDRMWGFGAERVDLQILSVGAAQPYLAEVGDAVEGAAGRELGGGLA